MKQESKGAESSGSEEKQPHSVGNGNSGSDTDEDKTPEVELSPDARIAALEEELEESRDRMLRALAEAENTRRRTARERKDAETYGSSKLARDLLGVFDNLERAITVANDDIRASSPDFVEGVELTHKNLLDAFAKNEIICIAPKLGDKFDPKIHQAMFEAPSADHPKGSVSQLLQMGFSISERLLRPALVGVASGPVQAQTPEEANNTNTESDKS